MTPGKLIALEGLAPDHAELLKRLQSELVAMHVPARLMPPAHESADITTQTVASILTDERYPKSPRVNSLLDNATITAERDSITQDLERGIHCLTGRGTLTALVTDYYGLGVVQDYQQLSQLADFATGRPADLTIVLDTPTTDLTEAAKHEFTLPTGTKPDLALFERIRAGYLWEAKQRNLPVVDASGGNSDTFEQVWRHVSEFLGLSTPAPASHDTQSVAEVLAAKPPQKAKTVEGAKPFASDNFGSSKPEGQPAEAVEAVSMTILASAYVQANHTVDDHDYTTAYDQKDEAGHYRYYIPAELKGKVRSQYIRTMNQQFDTYSEMAASLKAYLAKASRPESDVYHTLADVLPLAATGNVVLADDKPNPLPSSLSETASLAEAKPAHFRSIDDRKLADLAAELLPPNFTATDKPVQLLDFSPRNELELAATVLFDYTDLPSKQLHETASSWTYQQKVDALALACSAYPDATLEATQYTFDLVTTFSMLYGLLAHHVVHDVRWQLATPRLGYDVPRLVEEAGLSDHYEQCFDHSLELFSALHAAKGMHLAQYTTLQGHNVRWTCSLNGRQAAQLMRTLPSLQRKAGEFNVLQQMFEQIAEVHPLLAENLVDKSTRPPVQS